jgi:histidyl-tRNA synthetase
MVFQPVRGTHDILPEECLKKRYITNIAREIAERYGFQEMDTPLFEFTNVFHHMGETSDVVTKETYTFEDRGGDSLTLRPEGTAGIMRAIVSNGLTQNTPIKFLQTGPMFRYERPQKGRYRQFHQLSIELVGVPEPVADIETIALAHQILSALDLDGGFTLELNTLGDQESRDAYRTALIEYLNDHRDTLSKESLERLEKNPLRILDSKDKNDQILVENAPIYRDYLSAKAEDFFAEVLKGLDQLSIPYDLNYRIVRGLDYYCHTTFEFVSKSLGAQGTVLAGGRYDGLVKRFGGPDLPGVGWAAGIERLTLLANHSMYMVRPATLIPLGTAAEEAALLLSYQLRARGISIDMGYSGNLSKRMKRATKQNAKWAVIFGDDELAAGEVIVRDLDTGTQQNIVLSAIGNFLKQTK